MLGQCLEPGKECVSVLSAMRRVSTFYYFYVMADAERELKAACCELLFTSYNTNR